MEFITCTVCEEQCEKADPIWGEPMCLDCQDSHADNMERLYGPERSSGSEYSYGRTL